VASIASDPAAAPGYRHPCPTSHPVSAISLCANSLGPGSGSLAVQRIRLCNLLHNLFRSSSAGSFSAFSLTSLPEVLDFGIFHRWPKWQVSNIDRDSPRSLACILRIAFCKVGPVSTVSALLCQHWHHSGLSSRDSTRDACCVLYCLRKSTLLNCRTISDERDLGDSGTCTGMQDR
jgi:hypothetical protein